MTINGCTQQPRPQRALKSYDRSLNLIDDAPLATLRRGCDVAAGVDAVLCDMQQHHNTYPQTQAHYTWVGSSTLELSPDVVCLCVNVAAASVMLRAITGQHDLLFSNLST